MSSTSWRLCEAILFCESEGQAVRKSEGLAREYGDRHGNPVIQCMVAYTGRGGASLCTIIWQTESQQSYPGLHSKFKKQPGLRLCLETKHKIPKQQQQEASNSWRRAVVREMGIEEFRPRICSLTTHPLSVPPVC